MMMLRSSDFILVMTNWYLMGLLILSIIRRAATDQLGSYIFFARISNSPHARFIILLASALDIFALILKSFL